MRGNETFLIFVLLLTTLAHVLDFVIMMPIGPKLMTEFSITAALFGYIVSIYTLAAAASSFFSAIWMDRVNLKHGLLILLLGFTIGNSLCAWSPSVTVLVAGRVIAGVFGGVMQAIVFSIISKTVSASRQGAAAGMMGTAFPLVSIVGVPIGLRIADFFGWRMAFVLVLGASLVALVMSIIALPSLKPSLVQDRRLSLVEPFTRVVRYGPHRWGFALIFLTVLGGFTIVPYIAPFLINNQYIEDEQLYLVYLVGGIFAVISSRVIGGMADRYGKVRVLRVVVGVAVVILFFFTNLPHHSLTLVLIATSVTMMALPGRFVCVMSWVTTVGQQENRGAFLSLVSTSQQLTIGLASVIGGLLVGEAADGRFHTYWLAGSFAIGANLLILLLTPRLQHIEDAVYETKPSASASP